MFRACLVSLVLVVPLTARAGTVVGKLDLPGSLERPALAIKGFLDRVENPLAPVKAFSPAREMTVVLENNDKPVSPAQVVIELLGESFSRRVVAAPVGAEVVIKNVSKSARTLVAAEDPKLIPQGPINPTGPKSFRVTDAGKIYSIGDKDAPHLRLKIVVVNTQFVGYPDDAGKFEIDGVPPGSYKLRIWLQDKWLAGEDQNVSVAAKGKTDVNHKLAAAVFAPAAKK